MRFPFIYLGRDVSKFKDSFSTNCVNTVIRI